MKVDSKGSSNYREVPFVDSTLPDDICEAPEVRFEEICPDAPNSADIQLRHPRTVSGRASE